MSELFLYLAAVFSSWYVLLGGLIGALDAAIFLVKKERRKVIEKEIIKYSGYLAGVLILFGCFNAWKYEHRNLEIVKTQRSNDVGEWNLCKGDLRLKSEMLAAFQRHNATQQATIGGLQGTLNSEQAAVNNCVVSLGKKAIGEPVMVSLFTHYFEHAAPSQRLTGIILIPSQSTTMRGELECKNAFNVPEWRMAVDAINNAEITSLAPNRKHFSVGSPPWEKGVPVFILAAGTEPLGECHFTLQPLK